MNETYGLTEVLIWLRLEYKLAIYSDNCSTEPSYLCMQCKPLIEISWQCLFSFFICKASYTKVYSINNENADTKNQTSRVLKYRLIFDVLELFYSHAVAERFKKVFAYQRNFYFFFYSQFTICYITTEIFRNFVVSFNLLYLHIK